VKIVSWNIRHGYDVERAIEELATNDLLRGADVVFLQEMDSDGAAAVAEALGHQHVYAAGSSHYRTGREFGNAVSSPWPLDDHDVVELPHKARFRGQPRVAVKTVATVDGQLAVLGQAAATWPTELAVIGGDFNTVSARSVRSLVDRFESHGFAYVSRDAVSTLRRIGQDFTLDHIFARGFHASASGVARGVDVSDHDPVWAEIVERSDS
jgi:endonuclease/exonuclease/phosphatase family metal-dependent hydrolase